MPYAGNVCPMVFADGVLPAEVAAALRRPPGARFHRVALQVNPYAYLVRHAKATAYQDEQAYNAAMVDAFLRYEIKAIAVTDHFRIETSDQLAAAARAAGIVVFPGFEAASKEGVHLLFLFDPDRPSRQIERIIGECGMHSDTEPSPLGNLDAEQLLARAHGWQAVVIAAHVTSQAGACFGSFPASHGFACGNPRIFRPSRSQVPWPSCQRQTRGLSSTPTPITGGVIQWLC